MRELVRNKSVHAQEAAWEITVAKSVGVPVVCLSGAVRHGFEEIYECGVTAALSITTRPMTLAESIKRAPVLLERNARAITRLVAFKREK